MSHPTIHEDTRIAVIGMAGRFPGAKNVEELWHNLRLNLEIVETLSDEELRAAGVPKSLIENPNYVKVSTDLSDIDLFDANYFNYSAREAEYLDPQQRLFLECAVETLESAGCDPSRYKGPIGVFAGVGLSTYLFQIWRSMAGEPLPTGPLRTMIMQGNDKDYVATRASYKLNLRGPSMTVQTACSTSLAAVHVACQSLLAGECKIALAGGVSVLNSPKRQGYLYAEGGILSPDGHCRPFDAKAQGTFFADGLGLIALKRLSDAIEDGDNIRAVILGSAYNNDGSSKVGFTAPSVPGQSAVIREALAKANVSPDTIDYIETHGTGTAMGDPIEIEALNAVFKTDKREPGSCLIGSIKSSIGHLNTAAGIASLIKAILCLDKEGIPSSLNFDVPNPEIPFDRTPFAVNTQFKPWQRGARARRLGISSFGMGGTNVHAVLEEAPVRQSQPSARKAHVALLSARSPAALENAINRFEAWLVSNQQVNIADICHTLANGRRLHDHTCAVVCTETWNAATNLSSRDPGWVFYGSRAKADTRPIVFMFSGQATQYANMGAQLYESEPVFRTVMDECASVLRKVAGFDLLKLLFSDEQETGLSLWDTRYAQPAIFSVSIALARLWESLGITPSAMIGHSIGELAAACHAGVISLEDALKAVSERGRLMQEMPAGDMLAILAPETTVRPLLGATDLAAVNAASVCVAAGSTEDIEDLKGRLDRSNIGYTPLRTSHAFHSASMQPAVEPFVAFMRGLKLNKPRIPFISNVTGDWITDEEATDPAYWGRHLRQPVLFYKGLKCLCDEGESILLEVGPGQTLTQLAKRMTADLSGIDVYPSTARANMRALELETWLGSAAQLWCQGLPIDWSHRYEGERRYKVDLPTYPFERRRYWVNDEERPRAHRRQDNAAKPQTPVAAPEPEETLIDSRLTYSTVTWKRVLASSKAARTRAQIQKKIFLVIGDGSALQTQLVRQLQNQPGAYRVVKAVKSKTPSMLDADNFHVDMDNPSSVENVVDNVHDGSDLPICIIYLCDPVMGGLRTVSTDYDALVSDKMVSLCHLARVLIAKSSQGRVSVLAVTREAYQVSATDNPEPLAALTVGPSLVANMEVSNVAWGIIDIPVQIDAGLVEKLAVQIANDLEQAIDTGIVAYRDGSRWRPMIDPLPKPTSDVTNPPLRQVGVYLITGGLGDLGLALAGYLASTYQAKLVLVSRTPLPDRGEWQALLESLPADHRHVRMIKGITALESIGAHYEIAQCDVSDSNGMVQVVRETIARHGALHGVIHAAGVAGSTPMAFKTKEEIDIVLKPKLLGLAALEKALQGVDLDFLALFSSVSSLASYIGQSDYSSANAVLDVYAQSHAARSPFHIVSINWTTWGEIGMAVHTATAASREALKQTDLRSGLTTAEGMAAFVRALDFGYPQIGVLRDTRVRDELEAQNSVAEDESDDWYLDENEQAEAQVDAKPQTRPDKKTTYHPRLPSYGPYVAPTREIEMVIATMWRDILKIEQVGIEDNFFDLGGHSLIAIQMIPIISKNYGIEFQAKDFFAIPTPAGISATIEAKIMEQIENMSEEEIENLVKS